MDVDSKNIDIIIETSNLSPNIYPLLGSMNILLNVIQVQWSVEVFILASAAFGNRDTKRGSLTKIVS